MIYVLGYLGLCVICLIILARWVRQAPRHDDWD